MTAIWCWVAAGSINSRLARKKSNPQVWAEYAIVKTLVAALEHLPLAVARRLAHMLGRLLNLLVPKLRRTAIKNLSFAFADYGPDERHKIVDGVFESISRMLLALARFPKLDRHNIGEWIRYEGLEHYLAAKQQGRGVLIATAHLGNWELSAFSHALLTEPMNVMIRPLDNPLIDHLVEHRRALGGNKLISKRESARSVLAALRQNEAVGILIDQNTTAGEGVFIDFFGKPACAGSAFVKLAHHTNAAVILGYALWNESESKYVLRFHPPFRMSGEVTADTQQIHSAIERVIREHPSQWMWIHRRWKTRPPGEDPLY
jgi:Kdo2-lipid IVA lauroyltransferase/acyltransferase